MTIKKIQQMKIIKTLYEIRISEGESVRSFLDDVQKLPQNGKIVNIYCDEDNLLGTRIQVAEEVQDSPDIKQYEELPKNYSRGNDNDQMFLQDPSNAGGLEKNSHSISGGRE